MTHEDFNNLLGDIYKYPSGIQLLQAQWTWRDDLSFRTKSQLLFTPSFISALDLHLLGITNNKLELIDGFEFRDMVNNILQRFAFYQMLLNKVISAVQH